MRPRVSTHWADAGRGMVNVGLPQKQREALPVVPRRWRLCVLDLPWGWACDGGLPFRAVAAVGVHTTDSRDDGGFVRGRGLPLVRRSQRHIS